MLHTRDDFLADKAAFPERYAVIHIHQHIMREGIVQRIIGPCNDDAIGDAGTEYAQTKQGQ